MEQRGWWKNIWGGRDAHTEDELFRSILAPCRHCQHSSEFTPITFHMQVLHLKNHSMVWIGKDLKDHLVLNPLLWPSDHVAQSPSNLALNSSRDRAATASQGTIYLLRQIPFRRSQVTTFPRKQVVVFNSGKLLFPLSTHSILTAKLQTR